MPAHSFPQLSMDEFAGVIRSAVAIAEDYLAQHLDAAAAGFDRAHLPYLFAHALAFRTICALHGADPADLFPVTDVALARQKLLAFAQAPRV
jgi:hypothetical protein